MGKYVSKLDRRRQAQGEVVGGGYIVFRRGKKWNRIRFAMKNLWHMPFEWPTFKAAHDEAVRLATKFPGEKFCVFEEQSQITISSEGGVKTVRDYHGK